MKTVRWGARLQQAREMAGLGQHELERLAGLCVGHVWQLEKGHGKNPTLSTLEKVRGTLGLRLDWLVHGIGQPPEKADVLEAVARAARATG